MNRTRTAAALTAGAVFLGCIVAANYVTTRYAMVPVGLGLVATAGTYFAGATFVARDAVHDALGRGTWRARLATIALIGIGAALSALLSPALAVASAAAFLLSELADLAVYEPLRKRGYIRAAIASNVVGSVVDSLVFLTLAGFPLVAAMPGQVIGKTWITLAVIAAVVAVRAARRVRTVTA